MTAPWPGTDDDSIGKGAQWVGAHLEEGTHCPVCTQLCALRRISITKAMVRALAAHYRAHGMGFEHTGKGSVAYAENHEVSTLCHWNLVEAELGHRPDGGRKGVYRLTELGREFLQGRAQVQKYKHIFNNQAHRSSGPQVNVHSVISDFDLQVLLNRVDPT